MLCRSPFMRTVYDDIGGDRHPVPLDGSLLSPDHNYHDRVRGLVVPCGHCMPCRIAKRRVWTTRLILESRLYPADQCCFVTFTYAPSFLPQVNGRPTLLKRDVQLLMKRIRKAYPGRTIRYYAAGEYGELNGRPHYHIIFFGLGMAEARGFMKAWQNQGIVHIGKVNPASIQYAAGYVSKKVMSEKDLEGREPEFQLASRKPGIGADYVPRLVAVLNTKAGRRYLEEKHDVPHVIQIGRKKWPLGRFLVGKLRESMGIDARDIIEDYMNVCWDSRNEKLAAWQLKYIDMNTGEVLPLTDLFDYRLSLQDEMSQKCQQMESRYELFHPRRT